MKQACPRIHSKLDYHHMIPYVHQAVQCWRLYNLVYIQSWYRLRYNFSGWSTCDSEWWIACVSPSCTASGDLFLVRLFCDHAEVQIWDCEIMNLTGELVLGCQGQDAFCSEIASEMFKSNPMLESYGCHSAGETFQTQNLHTRSLRMSLLTVSTSFCE